MANRYQNELVQRKLGVHLLRFVVAASKAIRLADAEKGQSISTVMQELRYDGWKNLGNHNEFEDLLIGAGFEIRHEYKGDTGIRLRTYVKIPDHLSIR